MPWSWFQPDFRICHVTELTLERITALGLKYLLLDVDCTLKRYPATELPGEVLTWLESMRKGGITCCIVSNGRTHRIGQLAEKYGILWVAKALKPLPWGVRRAMAKLDAKPEETAMVGDQLFADIWAGKWAGIKTILVEPIRPEEEPFYTRLKRIPERWAMRKERD